MKVMIVDDEIRIGNLIKNLIEWDRLGLELIGVFQNGYDVLERFQSEPADILICDIEMPEMNGIELIKRVSKEYPSTRCVIVSGFQNFEYARQAMQYGVDYYILKPIDEDELNNTLNQICRSKAKEREKTGQERNALFLAVQNGSYQPMSVPEINRTYGFSFAEGSFFFLKIMAPSEDALETILRYLMAKMPLITKDCAFFGKEQNSVSALINPNAAAAKDDFEELFKEALVHAEGMLRKPAYIFVGKDFSDTKRLAEENTGINRASWQRLFLHKTGVCHAEAEEPAGTVSLTESENNRLMKAVESVDKTTFSKLIREIYSERLQQLKKAPYLTETVTETIGMSVFNKMYNLGVRSKDFSVIRDRIEKMLHAAIDPDDVINGLVDILYQDIQDKLIVFRDDESDYVRQAKNYILKNYNRNISLESLAEELRLNQSYVSSIFKDGTGINFKQFLTDVRMDNAKRLLRETNLNISQIAYEVGYKNAFYFANTFTAHEGVKPQEYRRMHRSIK